MLKTSYATNNPDDIVHNRELGYLVDEIRAIREKHNAPTNTVVIEDGRIPRDHDLYIRMQELSKEYFYLTGKMPTIDEYPGLTGLVVRSGTGEEELRSKIEQLRAANKWEDEQENTVVIEDVSDKQATLYDSSDAEYKSDVD